MSYIDVDKFAEKICNFQAIDENAANAMIWLLRTFPTADVVEVVRCKDCKHGQRNNYGQLKGHYICEYHQDGPLKHRDHYCGSGERIEE